MTVWIAPLKKQASYTWQINTRDYEESRPKPNNTVAIKGSDFQVTDDSTGTAQAIDNPHLAGEEPSSIQLTNACNQQKTVRLRTDAINFPGRFMEWKNGNIPHINGVTCELTDNDANHNLKATVSLEAVGENEAVETILSQREITTFENESYSTSFSVPGLSVTAPYAVNNSNDDADNQKHIAMDIVLSQAEADTNDCSTELYFDSCTVYYNLSQTLNLPEGWSMFSTYIQENNMSVDHLFADQSNKVIIVKNNVGATWLPDLLQRPG